MGQTYDRNSAPKFEVFAFTRHNYKPFYTFQKCHIRLEIGFNQTTSLRLSNVGLFGMKVTEESTYLPAHEHLLIH